MQSVMKRDATCPKSEHPSHRPARSRAVRRDRLSAFNHLILENQSMVYNLAYCIVGDPDLAAAATECTFLRAYRGVPRRRGQSPGRWLLRIAVTVCQEKLCQVPIPNSDLHKPSVGDDAHETITAPSARQPSPDGVQALLNAVPPSQRIPLVLSDAQGLSYREIADVTGVSVDVVQSRLSRGRTALRNALLARGEISPGVQP